MHRFEQEAVVVRERAHIQVLVVDDDAAVRRAVARLLRHFGFSVVEAASGDGALLVLAGTPRVNVIILDQSMPTGWGPSFATRFRVAMPSVRLLVYSAQDVSPEDRLLIDDVLVKPASPSGLVHMVDRWAGLA